MPRESEPKNHNLDRERELDQKIEDSMGWEGGPVLVPEPTPAPLIKPPGILPIGQKQAQDIQPAIERWEDDGGPPTSS